MRTSVLVALLIATALFPVAVSAAVVRSGEDFVLRQNEVIPADFYVAGNSIVLSGESGADLVAAGGSVRVNGPVRADATVAGGTVDVLGPVAADLRVAAGHVTISSTVGEEVFIVAGTVHILPTAVITGDLVVFAGRLIIDGEVKGGVKFSGSDLRINGAVEGVVDAHVSNKIQLGSTSKVAGLVYQSPSEAVIEEGATVSGEVIYNRSTVAADAQRGAAAFFSIFFIGKLFAVLTASLVVVLAMRRFSTKVANAAVAHFGMNTLVGFGAVILLPIASILLILTVFGALLGLLGLVGFVLLALAANVVAGIIAGGLLSKLIQKTVVVDWKWTIAGVLALQLISLIPIIGIVTTAVFLLASLGTLAYLAWSAVSPRRLLDRSGGGV